MIEKKTIPIIAPMAAYMNNHMIGLTDGRIITPVPVYAAADPIRPPTSAWIAAIGIPTQDEKKPRVPRQTNR